jgi:hypothetical protein
MSFLKEEEILLSLRLEGRKDGWALVGYLSRLQGWIFSRML